MKKKCCIVFAGHSLFNTKVVTKIVDLLRHILGFTKTNKGGHQPQKWGRQPDILTDIPPKLHENEENWTWGVGGGHASLAPPRDPPMCYHVRVSY